MTPYTSLNALTGINRILTVPMRWQLDHDDPCLNALTGINRILTDGPTQGKVGALRS